MIWYTRKESTLPRGEDESALFRRRVDDLWQQISMQRAWTTRPLLTNASLICIVPSFVSVRLAEISKFGFTICVGSKCVEEYDKEDQRVKVRRESNHGVVAHCIYTLDREVLQSVG